MHHSSKLLQENIKHCQFLAIKGTRKASPKIIILAWRKFGRFITSSKHSREPLCEVVTARINCVSCLESITTMQYYSEINQDKIVIKTSFSRLTVGTNWFSIVVWMLIKIYHQEQLCFIQDFPTLHYIMTFKKGSNGNGLSGRIRIYKKTDNPFRFQTDSFSKYPVPFIT